MKKILSGFLIGAALAISASVGALVSSAPASLPAGTILDFAGTTVPAGYVKCDGAAISRSTAYFTAVGTLWGVGDGTTTVNVPNLNRRVTVGSGGTATGTLGNAVGNTGGEEVHTLTTAEIPAHVHTLYAGGAVGGSAQAAWGLSNTASSAYSTNQGTPDGGSSGSHNVRDPSAVVTKICKT